MRGSQGHAMHMLRLIPVVLILTCAALAFPEARRPHSSPGTPGQVRDAPARELLPRTGTATITGTVVVPLTFRALPPGEYRLSALLDLDPEPNVWFEPQSLEQLDITAHRVMLHAGGKKVQNVRVRSQE